MKKILLFSAVFCYLNLAAQTQEEGNAKTNASKLETTKQIKTEGWTKGGTLNLNFTEAGVNDSWMAVKGGQTSAIGIRAMVDYDFDYKKGKGTWLNNIRARYGMSKLSSAGDAFLKTDDYLNLTSTYAREIKPKWNFAALVNLETQFDYYFLSPGNIKFGPGIMYKPNTHFSALFSPAMGNIFTKTAKEQRNILANNVDSGKTIKLGIGAFLQLKADYDIAKGINYKGFATFYSNYSNKPGSIILDYTNLFTLTVNKYIGATVSINIRNNDFEASGTQIQHGIGVGFSYKL